MFEELTTLELLRMGGPAVRVLLIFSVVSLAVILGRAWAFYRFSSGLTRTSNELNLRLRDGGVASAAEWCRARADRSRTDRSWTERSWTDALASVFLAGYLKRDKGRDEVLSAMELSGRREIAGLERYLGVLGTIGATAPFVGLFGTVLGIIRAFSDLAGETGAGPSVVAAGVSEALVATAAGLFVAIPAVMAYNFFVRAARRQSLELETLAAGFTESLLSGPETNK
jgi:biopolymer transport protein ExbB/TolQ